MSDPIIFSIEDIKIIPAKVPSMIRYEATLVTSNITRPIPIAMTDVSPTEPVQLVKRQS